METAPKYLDTDTVIVGFEEKTGSKASDYLVALAEDIVRIVNKAYEDGYAAGLDASHN